MMALIIVPVVVILGAIVAWLWGTRVAARAHLRRLAMGLLLIQVLLWRYADTPCARAWSPSGESFGRWWLAYVLGFVIFTSGVPRIERWLFDMSYGIAGFAAAAAVIALGLRGSARDRSSHTRLRRICAWRASESELTPGIIRARVYNSFVHIDSSAPTRIDLAGGTLDIWPLYLFHEGAQTLNVAISLRAHCRIRPRTDRRIVIVSEDTGKRVEADHWSALRDNAELRLLGRLLHHFQVEGLEVTTRSESPVGAGIAGSSALNIAVCGALAAWTGRSLPDDALLQIAMNVEAQAIDVPTGVQDYRPALYGGVSAVELGVAGVRRVGLPVDAQELEQRLVLAYTNASRNSGINNWEVTKRHIDGDREVQSRFARIRDIAGAMREALHRSDWPEVGRQVAAEWDNRKGLAPGVTTESHRRDAGCGWRGGRDGRQDLRRGRRRVSVLHGGACRRSGDPAGTRERRARACSIFTSIRVDSWSSPAWSPDRRRARRANGAAEPQHRPC